MLSGKIEKQKRVKESQQHSSFFQATETAILSYLAQLCTGGSLTQSMELLKHWHGLKVFIFLF